MLITMKKFLIPCIVLLLGCSKENDSGQFFLRIDDSQQIQNFSAEAGQLSFTVTTNCAIKTSSSQDWCTPVIMPGYTADNLKISVTSNVSTEARTAIVTVSSEEVKQIISIRVNQEGAKPAVSVKESGITLRSGELDFTLEVTSNMPIVFDKPAWITETGGNAWENGAKIYTFKAAPLPTGVSIREGDIVINTVGTFDGVLPIPVHVIQQQSRIIAHRGYWNKAGAAENSLASLNNAIELGAYGSELDVWITADNILVLNHDATYGGVNIESATSATIAPLRLSNGEPLPTLQQCIDIVKQQAGSNKTKLIIEIKTHSSNTNNKRCVDAVVQAVNNSQAGDLVDYIAFSSYVCEELIKINPQHRVAYLNGDMTPGTLKTLGYWGLDYQMNVLKSNTDMVNRAITEGLTTNVWTVNTSSDMQYFINMGVDFITTDEPHTLKNLLNK
jgi:glycerophosphoryl diester phosphodiesterase